MKILLATYNGAPWLDRLLRSVRAQTFSEWQMLVRDDGSTDATLDIVRSHSRQDARIQLIESSAAGAPHTGPIGPAESFFLLLEHVDETDLFAFCDQDDVWFPHKLEWSVEALATTTHPIAAVAHDAEVVDDREMLLEPSSLTRHGFTHAVSPGELLGKLLLNNVVVGATLAGTGRLAAVARDAHQRRAVSNPAFHDWWCVLVASYAGELEITPAPTMSWRRHDSTATGATPDGASGRAERRLDYLRWSIDSAQALVSACVAVGDEQQRVAEALSAIDPQNPPAGAIRKAWMAGARPWGATHYVGLIGALGAQKARNLRESKA